MLIRRSPLSVRTLGRHVTTTDMTFGILLGSAVLLLCAALALSIGQAWAIGGGRRRFRHLVVWALATATLPSLYTWQGGVWDWPMLAAFLAIGTPAALFGVALAVGVGRDRTKGLAGKRVLGLMGAHLAAGQCDHGLKPRT